MIRPLLLILAFTLATVVAQQTFPIRNGALQSDLNANGQGILNIGSLNLSNVGSFSAGNMTIVPEVPGAPEIVTISIVGPLADMVGPWVFTDGDGVAYRIDYLDSMADPPVYMWVDSWNWFQSQPFTGLSGAASALADFFNSLRSMNAVPEGWTAAANGATVVLTSTAPGDMGNAVDQLQGPQLTISVQDGIPAVTEHPVGNGLRITGGGQLLISQEGTGKFWRLKITGTETAPILTLSPVD